MIITEKLSCGKSNIPPSQERLESKKANSAMKAMMLTTMLATKLIAQDAPWDAASNRLVLSLRKNEQQLNGNSANPVNNLLFFKQHSIISILQHMTLALLQFCGLSQLKLVICGCLFPYVRLFLPFFHFYVLACCHTRGLCFRPEQLGDGKGGRS